MQNIWKNLKAGEVVDASSILVEEEPQVDLVKQITQTIESIVQNEINKYNKDNSMQFNNIDTIAKYINFPTYTHYTFVKQILEFNMQIWEKAREIQGQVLAGQLQISSIEDLLPLLPQFNFNKD